MTGLVNTPIAWSMPPWPRRQVAPARHRHRRRTAATVQIGAWLDAVLPVAVAIAAATVVVEVLAVALMAVQAGMGWR